MVFGEQADDVGVGFVDDVLLVAAFFVGNQDFGRGFHCGSRMGEVKRGRVCRRLLIDGVLAGSNHRPCVEIGCMLPNRALKSL